MASELILEWWVEEVRPEGPRVGGWGSWGGDSQPLPPTRGFVGAL